MGDGIKSDFLVLFNGCRCGDTKVKMKFATYRSTGFNYRSRRPTFKPKREELATTSAGDMVQPQAVTLSTLEPKSPVC